MVILVLQLTVHIVTLRIHPQAMLEQDAFIQNLLEQGDMMGFGSQVMAQPLLILMVSIVMFPILLPAMLMVDVFPHIQPQG